MAIANAGLPTNRPYVAAAIAPAVSPWCNTKRNPAAVAAPITSRFGPPPGTPNTVSAPSRRTAAIRASAVFMLHIIDDSPRRLKHLVTRHHSEHTSVDDGGLPADAMPAVQDMVLAVLLDDSPCSRGPARRRRGSPASWSPSTPRRSARSRRSPERRAALFGDGQVLPAALRTEMTNVDNAYSQADVADLLAGLQGTVCITLASGAGGGRSCLNERSALLRCHGSGGGALTPSSHGRSETPRLPSVCCPSVER